MRILPDKFPLPGGAGLSGESESSGELPPSIPPLPSEGWERVPEGRVRALCLSTNAVEILARFAKEPSSGLRPPSPMLRTGEGKTLVSSESRLSKICLHPCSCGPSWILRKFSPDSPAAGGRGGNPGREERLKSSQGLVGAVAKGLSVGMFAGAKELARRYIRRPFDR